MGVVKVAGLHVASLRREISMNCLISFISEGMVAVYRRSRGVEENRNSNSRENRSRCDICAELFTICSNGGSTSFPCVHCSKTLSVDLAAEKMST